MAAASSDDMQMVKLYPEGSEEARFKIRGVKRIFIYCNRDGLFSIDPVKGIDDKDFAEVYLEYDRLILSHIPQVHRIQDVLLQRSDPPAASSCRLSPIGDRESW